MYDPSQPTAVIEDDTETVFPPGDMSRDDPLIQHLIQYEPLDDTVWCPPSTVIPIAIVTIALFAMLVLAVLERYL